MDGAGAGGAARERRKQLTAAEAVNHKRQLAQMVERELALTGADSVTDFDDALQMVLVETAFGRYPKHLLDVYTGKVVGRQERGDVVARQGAGAQAHPHPAPPVFSALLFIRFSKVRYPHRTFRNDANFECASGFVKTSATWKSVPIPANSMSPLRHWSRTK